MQGKTVDSKAPDGGSFAQSDASLRSATSAAASTVPVSSRGSMVVISPNAGLHFTQAVIALLTPYSLMLYVFTLAAGHRSRVGWSGGT